MKKFALVAAVLLLTTGFVFASPGSNDAPTAVPTASDTVVVTAALQGYLTLSDLTPATTFLLNTAGDTVNVADATVATNLRNWNMTITANSSTSTDSALVSTDGNAYRIPYQLSLTSADPTISSADWSAAYIKTGGISKDFHSRVSGGADGKSITLSITYGGEQTATWFAGLTYTDTITVTVKAL